MKSCMIVKIRIGELIARTLVCASVCIFGLTSTAAEFNKIVYSDSGDIVPGEMTSQFMKAKTFADSKNIPLVVMWVDPGCGYCENFERSCLWNEAVLAWMKEKKYVFVFCFGQDDSDGKAAWSYTRQADANPMCRVHWKKNTAGGKVDYSFTGRPKKMHESQAKSKLSFAEQFMEVVDLYVGDYAAGAGEGPTCEDGTIAEVGGTWVVTPNTGVTALTIAGLPEGAKLAVKCGDYSVPSAAFVGFGEGKAEGVFSLALDENGVVTLDGEEIPVRPTIGDLNEGEPFTVGKGVVMVAARTIPGLRYTLVRGETVENCRRDDDGSTVVESVVATGARVALTDANPPAGKAFYVISVSCPAAVVPSDSTIRIVGGRVYSGQYDITDAVTVREDGTVELKAGGVVGGVKVTPMIGDLPPSSDGEDDAASQLFLGGADGVSLQVQQAIPGLCYCLLRGETPDRVDELVDWHLAESETVTLRDFNPPKNGAFYRIKVGLKVSDGF